MSGDPGIRRLPAWADRIHVGNAVTWNPPRRYDFVRTELVYVPPGREPSLISHLLEHVVAPGGRLILCAYRPRGETDAAEIGDQLHSWGWTPAGEAVAHDHVRSGIATRVVWLDAPVLTAHRPRQPPSAPSGVPSEPLTGTHTSERSGLIALEDP